MRANVRQERHRVATATHLPAVLAHVALVLLPLAVDLLGVLHDVASVVGMVEVSLVQEAHSVALETLHNLGREL